MKKPKVPSPGVLSLSRRDTRPESISLRGGETRECAEGRGNEYELAISRSHMSNEPRYILHWRRPAGQKMAFRSCHLTHATHLLDISTASLWPVVDVEIDYLLISPKAVFFHFHFHLHFPFSSISIYRTLLFPAAASKPHLNNNPLSRSGERRKNER